jgi:hypothetical protein
MGRGRNEAPGFEVNGKGERREAKGICESLNGKGGLGEWEGVEVSGKNVR